MNYKNVERLLECRDSSQYRKEWVDYLQNRKAVYEMLDGNHIESNMISEANWILRSKYCSGEEIGINVQKGDICYMDFGQAYRSEAGYQHFGLVMTVFRRKAMVIPMTSNPVQFKSAWDPIDNPEGKEHLMRLGQIGCMSRQSVLFLNDLKFVNTARVIEVKAHMDPESELFLSIQKRVMDVLFD